MNNQETEYKSYESVQMASGMFHLKPVYKDKFHHDYAKLLASLERSKTLRIADGRISKISRFLRNNVSQCDYQFREQLNKDALDVYCLAISNVLATSNFGVSA
jgi:hypothetical protein